MRGQAYLCFTLCRQAWLASFRVRYITISEADKYSEDLNELCVCVLGGVAIWKQNKRVRDGSYIHVLIKMQFIISFWEVQTCECPIPQLLESLWLAATWSQAAGLKREGERETERGTPGPSAELANKSEPRQLLSPQSTPLKLSGTRDLGVARCQKKPLHFKGLKGFIHSGHGASVLAEMLLRNYGNSA